MRLQRIGRGALTGAWLISVVAAVGCDAEQPTPDGALRVSTAALAPCVDNENGNRAFPSGADRVVARLTGGAIPADQPVVASFTREQGASGSVILTNVPPGEGMRLDVVGCAGAEVIWAGRSDGVAVTAHQKTFPDIFLTPIGEPACVGQATTPEAKQRSSVPRAFAGDVTTADGALLVGGFQAFDPVTKVAPGTDTVERYARTASAFGVAGKLTGPRGAALARPLGDGTVLVAGGTRALAVALPPDGALQRAYPMIWSFPQDRPECGFEIFDPATGTASCASDTVLPALPAVAPIGADGVVAVGGVETDTADAKGRASRNVTVRATGAEKSFQLAHPRFGATVVPLGGDLVLVWGGNGDAAVANAGEVLDVASGTSTPLQVTGLDAVPVLAAGTWLGTDAQGGHRVLVAGGGDVRTAFPWYVHTVSRGRVDVVTVDLQQGVATVTPVDLGDAASSFRRAAARIVGLESGDLWMVGGITSFTKAEDICGDAPDCLPGETVVFSVDDVGTLSIARELELSVGPMGATPVQLGDVSWLVAGGFTTVASANALDAEANVVRFATLAPELCALP